MKFYCNRKGGLKGNEKTGSELNAGSSLADTLSAYAASSVSPSGDSRGCRACRAVRPKRRRGNSGAFVAEERKENCAQRRTGEPAVSRGFDIQDTQHPHRTGGEGRDGKGSSDQVGRKAARFGRLESRPDP